MVDGVNLLEGISEKSSQYPLQLCIRTLEYPGKVVRTGANVLNAAVLICNFLMC